MANTPKSKAEILQELESIKGLLLENDDIPLLQEFEEHQGSSSPLNNSSINPSSGSIAPLSPHNDPSVLPGQVGLFDDHAPSNPQEFKSNSESFNHAKSFSNSIARPLAKASGENPFLPQHIRARLHGNNPPPQFEYETAKKILNATKNIQHKINQPRQHLVNEVITAVMPKIEQELKERLFAMSLEDLEKLLNDED